MLPFRKHSYNCWQLVVTYNLRLSSENPSENILVQLLEAVVTYNKMLSSICTGCCFYSKMSEGFEPFMRVHKTSRTARE